jgi:transposase
MAKPLLPDDLWELIRPLLPPPKPRRFRFPGRRPVDDRTALAGIIFVLKTGIPWEDFPPEMGCCGMTLWNRLHAWARAGVWQKVHEILLARLREADRIDFSRVVVDSSSVRAVLGGHGPAPARWTGRRTAPSTT